MKCIIKACAPRTDVGLSKKQLARTGSNNLLPHKLQLKCLVQSTAMTRSLYVCICSFICLSIICLFVFILCSRREMGKRSKHLPYSRMGSGQSKNKAVASLKIYSQDLICVLLQLVIIHTKILNIVSEDITSDF
jgi:hypothetical protein